MFVIVHNDAKFSDVATSLPEIINCSFRINLKVYINELKILNQ
jgi:hypothetical protein